MRHVILLSALLVSAAPAGAQTFSPISGPNDAIPSPVCDLINFGFCPQPAPPAPPFSDPDAAALRPAASVPPPVLPHRRLRRHVRRLNG